MAKIVKRTERHIRWNCEISSPYSERGEGEEMLRYHFVVVDDRDREGIMNQLLERLRQFGGAVDVIREQYGDVKGSRLKYLFKTVDSRTASSALSFTGIGKPIKRDRDLRERERGNIEDYVDGIYNLRKHLPNEHS